MERIIKIIEILKTEKYLSAAEIANRVGVSSKTIRNDLKEMENLLLKTGARIEMCPRIGIRLDIFAPTKFAEKWQQLKQTMYESHNDSKVRVELLIEYLITTKDTVCIDDLCEILFVSRTTLKKDLAKVRKILKQFNIMLDCRANQGIRVVGSEKQFRRCLARMKLEFPIHTDVFGDENLLWIHKMIVSILNAYQFQIADLSIHNLMIHIYVAIKRIQAGKVIEFEEQINDILEKDQDLKIAKEIVTNLEKHYEIVFPQNELYYILMHLNSKKVLELNKVENNTVVTDDIYKMVNQMLEAVNQSFKIDLRYDLKLITLLSLHLVPFKVRLVHDMTIYNPMLEEIRTYYMLAYNMATVACHLLQEKFHKTITKDEIAYIALHFNLALERLREQKKENVLIVCGSGRGSAELLAYQVKENFGKYFNVIATESRFHLEKISFTNIDYILTTVPIHEVVPVPIIEVKTFLASQELHSVKKVIYDQRIKQVMQFFATERIIKTVEKDRLTILQILCQKSAEYFSLSDSFYQNVLEREEMGNTSFANFIAIPHPIHPFGDTSFVSLAVLETPIQWQDEEVQIVFLLSMREHGDEQLHHFYKIMTYLMSHKQAVLSLIEQKNEISIYEQLEQIVKQVFHSFP